MTRSPALRLRTSAPLSTTSPAHSSPTVAPAWPWPPAPRAADRSARFRPAARTFTSTSCGFGWGCGISRSSRPFGVPTAAFMVFLVCWEIELADRLRLDAVPPRTDTRRKLVIAVHHLDGTPVSFVGQLEAQVARLGAVLRRQPGALVAPHARSFAPL